HKGGKSVYADRCDSTSNRAQRCKRPRSAQSTLFHRWMLGLTGLPKGHGFEYVKCRSNLRTSTALHGNIFHMKRLKRAFWVEGVAG
ncbi:unnamed protein product, partial [Ectocarpus sp. 12 AP-2014]